MKHLIALGALLALTYTLVATATDRFITPADNVTQAVSMMKSGDRLFLHQGNYPLVAPLVQPSALITILPYPGEIVTLQPTGSPPVPFTWAVDILPTGKYEDALALPVPPPITAMPPSGDTIAPTITWVTPNNASFTTNDISVRVAPRDNIRAVRVELFRNGQAKPIVVNEESQMPLTTYLRWQTIAMPLGTYTLTAYAYDAAGNKSLPATVTVIRK